MINHKAMTEVEQILEYAKNNPLPGPKNADESLLELARIQQESFQTYMQPDFLEGHSPEAIKEFCAIMGKSIKQFGFFIMDLQSRNYQSTNQY